MRQAAERREPASSSGADNSFYDYETLLRQRWWLVLLGVLTGLLLSALAIAVIPKTYTSTAAVLVREASSGSTSGNSATTAEVNLDTEAQVVKSSVVASLAAEKLDTSQTPLQLSDRLRVTVPPNSGILNISFDGSTPSRAAAGAQSFADAYLEQRRSDHDQRVKDHDDSVRETIASLDKQLERVSQRLSSATSAQRPYLSSQRSDLQARLRAQNTQIGAYGVEGADVGAVITEPVTPQSASAPNLPIIVTSGLMMGLLLGVGAALLANRLDGRVRGRRDIVGLGLDLLAPRLVLPADRSIIAPSSSRFDVNAIRSLRNSVLAQLPGQRGAIMFAPVSRDTTAASVSINVGAAMSRVGLKSVVVSADDRVPDLASAQVGLGQVLLGKAELGDVLISEPAQPGLTLIHPGLEQSLTSELLQSHRMGRVVAELRSRYDIVIMDVGATAHSADGQSLAPLFDGVVLVAVEDETERADVRDAINQFTLVSANVMGAALESTPGRSSRRTDRRGNRAAPRKRHAKAAEALRHNAEAQV